jgi:GT2 family glycosyltransferase
MKPRERNPTEYRFSVVIPTYNRPEALRKCLIAMTTLDYPKSRFEIIVVDDGGPQPIRPVVAAFENRLHIRLLRTENHGPAYARNVGVSAARGDWVAFTDDDCRVDPAWLRQLEECLSKHPDRLIGGRIVNLLEGNLFSVVSQEIIHMAYEFYNRSPGDARFFASNNMAVNRSAFEAMDGFDAAFARASEDRDLCDRWLLSDRGMAYCPRAMVWHAHSLSLGGFLRQHFRYGRGAYQYHQARRQRRSGTMACDTGFHLQLPRLVWERCKGTAPVRAVGVISLLMLWEIANLAGYMYEKLEAE